MYNPYTQANPMEAIRRNRLSVKGFLGTSNVLTLAVIQIISIVLSFITPIFSSPIVNELAYSLYARAYGPTYNYPSTSYSITLPVLPILIAIAFCLLRSAGKSKNPDTPNSAGATILMVVSIIKLVLICLTVVAVILLVILAIIFGSMASDMLRAGNSYNYSYGFVNGYADAETSFAILILVIALVILIGVVTLALIYAIGMVRLSSSLRKGLNSPELTAKGAKAVGVCSVFYAVFSGFGIILTPASILLFKYLYNPTITSSFIAYLFLSVISSVLGFVMHICMAKFAFSFNKHVQADTYAGTPSAAPVYNAPVQPFAPAYNTPAETATAQTTTFDDNEFTSYNSEPNTQQTPEYIDISEEAPATEFATTQSRCPVCGTETIPNQAFCAECGYKLN